MPGRRAVFVSTEGIVLTLASPLPWFLALSVALAFLAAAAFFLLVQHVGQAVRPRRALWAVAGGAGIGWVLWALQLSLRDHWPAPLPALTSPPSLSRELLCWLAAAGASGVALHLWRPHAPGRALAAVALLLAGALAGPASVVLDLPGPSFGPLRDETIALMVL